MIVGEYKRRCIKRCEARQIRTKNLNKTQVIKYIESSKVKTLDWISTIVW